MHEKRMVFVVLVVATALVALSCGESDSKDTGSLAGEGNPGGSLGGGGVSSTGAFFQTGGMPQADGAFFDGGNLNTGGVAPSGGSGQTNGGSGGIGGTVPTGGFSASGGNNSVGGTTATGGVFGTDGSLFTDGNIATGGVGGSAHTTPTFHVFLLLGQSNMEGYPKAQPADRAEDDRIQVLGYDNCAATGRQTDLWDLATPPLHSCWNDGLGPGDYFAKTMVEIIPDGDSIGLVPCAINGEKIETFMKSGGSKYNWIIQRARLAQQAGGVIEGILLHQGESNNGDPSWTGKVNTLVQDLRADLGLGQIPFIAGELLYSGSCAGHNALINQLPSVVANAHVVSANGLVVDPSDTQWRLHFDHNSQVTLGTRYAQKMIEALGW